MCLIPAGTAVDLWPSMSLHSELLRLDRSFFSTPRIAIVVAAFTLNPHALAGTSIAASMPRSLAELYACVRNRECTAFKGAADFVPGQHLATDYVRWWMSRAQALPYRIPCFDKVSYEPYLVVRKAWPNFAATDSRITADNQFNAAHGDDASAPVFDEEFTGYGKNKVQWVQQLRSRGFAFWTLPRGFLVHCPHAMSESGKKWQRNAGNHKARMDRLFEFQVAVSRAEEAEEALQPKNGDSVQKGGCPRRTPHCPVPLLQQVDMLQPAYLGKRTPSEVQG
uniref:Uncharacterized protein n=1 Tax=Chrysotila carterae TaxID=13221 RepID=A0A7S4B3X6_CHRCT